MPDLATQFAEAAAASKQLPKRPDNETLLKLYALYKQGSAGDVSGPAPGGFDFVGKAKHDAWSGLKGTPQDEAQRQYVALVAQLRQG